MPKTKANVSKYHLDKDGQFTIDDYNHTKPFSNFFPGVAGVWGVPMWVFFVNRGQCISSFGTESKDKAIVEFQPANKAYRLTSSHGFRTFLKVRSGSKIATYEPFQFDGHLSGMKRSQSMSMSAYDLTIEEVNATLGISVRVNYFTLPEEPSSALVRKVTITNISKKKLSIEMIDGLPVIVPFGLGDGVNKNMSRTVEAWMKVSNLKKRAPYFNLCVEVSDKPQVKNIYEGDFYFSFINDSSKKSGLLEMIVQPECVFGQACDFSWPETFYGAKSFKLPEQLTSNRTPCAMSFAKLELAPGKSKEVVSLAGFSHNVQNLNNLVRLATSKDFISKKAIVNKNIITQIKDRCFTHSKHEAFNQYCEQTFLDNVLRGGLPISLKSREGNVVFNVFSRKHGDLERDYNFFMLAPTYLSQGNGNYRDVNQNRRNDGWFNSDLKDSSIVSFLSLVQADGYNPLVVKGLCFFIEDDEQIEKLLSEYVVSDHATVLKEALKQGFLPGNLLAFMDYQKVKLTISAKDFLLHVLNIAKKQEEADHGEGFWSDHWHYNLDLISSYLGLYPDELQNLLFEKKDFYFYHNSAFVLPRSRRYCLTDNGVRQYKAVEEDEAVTETEHSTNELRILQGSRKGQIYYTTLWVKLICLVANKVATLDPSGIGIAMEADKPNWYDALNGLPGLLGSSISETFELKRLCLFMLDALENLGFSSEMKIKCFDELFRFVEELTSVVEQEEDAFKYWMKSNDLKEEYRLTVLKGISGHESSLTMGEVKRFLKAVIKRIDKGVKKATNSDGLFATYFSHEVTKYEKLGGHESGDIYVMPLEFKRHDLPYFLEGFVHAMRVGHQSDAKALAKKVKKSKLFDKKLKMYKVNSDLTKESTEIGRTRVFPRGWLENESVWLHMEFKYLLELFRNGLYEEFYEAIETALPPFMDPAVYGRSILENSSFIASSAHTDENLHGQGFVARLSGSTAEFVHMWLLMNVGEKPFSLDAKNSLTLKFNPALAGWLFTDVPETIEYVDASGKFQNVKLPGDTYAFTLFGNVLIVYHNPKHENTFGKGGVSPIRTQLWYEGQENPILFNSSTITGCYAQDVRDGKVARIDVFFT